MNCRNRLSRASPTCKNSSSNNLKILLNSHCWVHNHRIRLTTPGEPINKLVKQQKDLEHRFSRIIFSRESQVRVKTFQKSIILVSIQKIEKSGYSWSSLVISTTYQLFLSMVKIIDFLYFIARFVISQIIPFSHLSKYLHLFIMF